MKVIAGLGNPGLRYRRTRHNIGFMVVEALAGKYRIRLGKRGFKGRYGIGRIAGEETMLFEPMTFMNLSGEAVGAVGSKIEERQDLLVVLDDFNLPLGDIRFRAKGSDGGHNGVRSISASIGEDFSRLRLGIGNDIPYGDAAVFVLSTFLKKERPVLDQVIGKAVESIEVWLKDGITEAMNRYN